MTIITRSGKGSPLSFAEMDANLAQFDTKTRDGWRDNIASIDTRSGGTAPQINLYRDGIYLYEFSADSMNEVFASYHIDHDYKLGTMLYPHLHFTTTSTAAGVVRLGFEYTYAKGHQQAKFPAATTLTLNVNVPANSDHLHFVAEMPEGQGIPGTNIETDGVVLMRIFRDAGHVDDTFTGTIFGILVDLHYQTSQYATPNRAPDFFA